MASTTSEESNGHHSNNAINTNNKAPKNTLNVTEASPPKDDLLMKHIIEHLRYQGLDNIAESLESESKSNTDISTKNAKRSFNEMNTEPSYLSQLYDRNKNTVSNKKLISDEQVLSAFDFSLKSFGKYEQLFSHSNKSAISSISFSRDGLFNCIGCCNGTIRIFDVHKLHQSSNFNSLIKKYDSNSYSDIHRPLLSTLSSGYVSRINEMDFYPHLNRIQQLTSCCNGGFHIYEFNKKKSRKAPILSINECFNIKSVQYHPSGEYVLAGGDSCYVRLYDIKKEQGYIARQNDDRDCNINQIRWSSNGNIFASCSDNGDIRLYDGRSMTVINRLFKHHNSESITCIRFSNNNKYLLSAGYDNMVRLCDLRVGKQCQGYKGCTNNKNDKENGYKPTACFTFNDEHILCYSNVMNRIFVYDTNSGQKIYKFKDYQSNENKNGLTAFATSPTEPAFMCATANDNKNRFYATIKQLATDDDQLQRNININHNQINPPNHNDNK